MLSRNDGLVKGNERECVADSVSTAFSCSTRQPGKEVTGSSRSVGNFREETKALLSWLGLESGIGRRAMMSERREKS